MSGTRRALLAGALAAIVSDSAAAKRRRRNTHKKPKPSPTRPPIDPPCWKIGSGIRVINEIGTAWDPAIVATVERWNSQFPLATMRVDGGPETGAITITRAEPDSLLRGATLLWHDAGGYIGEASVLLDDAFYAALAPDDPARFAVICHDLGHSLGAPHAPAGTGGCMAEDRVAQGNPVVPGAWTLQNLIDAYRAAPPPRRR